jgi:diguanylate cyclase
MQYLFALPDIWSVNIPIPLALATIATIGYLVGRWSRKATSELTTYSKRELRRAQTVATELEKITWNIHKNLGKHHVNVTRFKEHVGKLDGKQGDAAWQELCREAEDMLKATKTLITQIADSYDSICKQSAKLMTFTELRTDPLTNTKNRRALDDVLQSQFALQGRYQTHFSIVILDIDHFKRINEKQGRLNKISPV